MSKVPKCRLETYWANKINIWPGPSNCMAASSCMAAYGPYGPQGPWTMGPMGPRGLGPIGPIFFLTYIYFVSPVGFQTTFWDFGHLKTYFGNTTPFCYVALRRALRGFLFGKKASPKKVMRIY